MDEKRPSPRAPDASGSGSVQDAIRPEDLSNRALLLLLAEVAEELQLRSAMQLGAFRAEFEQTVSDAIGELEKLVPDRPKAEPSPQPGEGPKSGIGRAKLRAIQAACAAGVPHPQVARHFGMTRAELRKVLAEPV